jgi:hypothetical protein
MAACALPIVALLLLGEIALLVAAWVALGR